MPRRSLIVAEARNAGLIQSARHLLSSGPDHPGTLTSRHAIAAMLADQGRLADAEAEFRQVLDAELRAPGPDHPNTLSTMNWLNSLQRRQDK
jgi:hypothetical protein